MIAIVMFLMAFQAGAPFEPLPLVESPGEQIIADQCPTESAPFRLAFFHSCEFQCTFFASKYNWTQEMVDNCFLNCFLGNGPCPLPPAECEPDEPDLSAVGTQPGTFLS